MGETWHFIKKYTYYIPFKSTSSCYSIWVRRNIVYTALVSGGIQPQSSNSSLSKFHPVFDPDFIGSPSNHLLSHRHLSCSVANYMTLAWQYVFVKGLSESMKDVLAVCDKPDSFAQFSTSITMQDNLEGQPGFAPSISWEQQMPGLAPQSLPPTTHQVRKFG